MRHQRCVRVASVMCAPLVSHGGESMGVIQLDSEDSRQPFSQDDLDLLVALTSVSRPLVGRQQARVQQRMGRSLPSPKHDILVPVVLF